MALQSPVSPQLLSHADRRFRGYYLLCDEAVLLLVDGDAKPLFLDGRERQGRGGVMVGFALVDADQLGHHFLVAVLDLLEVSVAVVLFHFFQLGLVGREGLMSGNLHRTVLHAMAV